MLHALSLRKLGLLALLLTALGGLTACENTFQGMGEDARSNSLRIGLRVDRVTRSGSTAVLRLVLTRGDEDSSLELQLVRRGEDWKVLRDSRTCGSVGCA